MTAIEPTPIPYTHSLKLEDTSKGLRISVHCYGNSEAETLREAFTMYLKAQQTARDNHIPLAPVEGNKGKSL